LAFALLASAWVKVFIFTASYNGSSYWKVKRLFKIFQNKFAKSKIEKGSFSKTKDRDWGWLSQY
jgi:hypothetical protein